jgi:hypothetical protein
MERVYRNKVVKPAGSQERSRGVRNILKQKSSIEQAYGRSNIRDSGYYRLFMAENPDHDCYDEIKMDIARLMSRIHSASITNGTRLETSYIGNPIYNENCLTYREGLITNENMLHPGHFIHARFSVLGRSIEVDYITVHEQDGHRLIRLFEIKDGGEMDTKKGASEVRMLMDVKEMLLSSCEDNADTCSIEIEMYIVLWNTDQITKKSFKTGLDKVHLVTGRQMCEMIGGIDFDRIVKDRRSIGPDNLNYTIKQLRTIVYKYDLLA